MGLKLTGRDAEGKHALMTTAPVPRLIGSLAVPTIVSMLVTSFYVMADTYFVGKINTQATAAVGISFSVMAVIQAFGFFFGHGSGNYISRRLGAHDYANAERMAATGFFCAFLAGVLIAVCGLAWLAPVCRLLGSTPTIQPYAETYLGIILLGAPFMTSSLVLNNQMRFQGNAVYAMVGITAGAVLNIGLDPLLIFVCDMGIAGAAWSTLASQLCSFAILVAMDRRGGNIRIRLRNFTPRAALLKEIVYGGSPSLCRQGLNSLSTILLNVAVFNFFWLRERMRGAKAVFHYIICPLCGVLILGYVWFSFDTLTQVVGFSWLAIGLIIGYVKSNGYKEVPGAFRNSHMV